MKHELIIEARSTQTIPVDQFFIKPANLMAFLPLNELINLFIRLFTHPTLLILYMMRMCAVKYVIYRQNIEICYMFRLLRLQF